MHLDSVKQSFLHELDQIVMFRGFAIEHRIESLVSKYADIFAGNVPISPIADPVEAEKEPAEATDGVSS